MASHNLQNQAKVLAPLLIHRFVKQHWQHGAKHTLYTWFMRMKRPVHTLKNIIFFSQLAFSRPLRILFCHSKGIQEEAYCMCCYSEVIQTSAQVWMNTGRLAYTCVSAETKHFRSWVSPQLVYRSGLGFFYQSDWIKVSAKWIDSNANSND